MFKVTETEKTALLAGVEKGEVKSNYDPTAQIAGNIVSALISAEEVKNLQITVVSCSIDTIEYDTTSGKKKITIAQALCKLGTPVLIQYQRKNKKGEKKTAEKIVTMASATLDVTNLQEFHEMAKIITGKTTVIEVINQGERVVLNYSLA